MGNPPLSHRTFPCTLQYRIVVLVAMCSFPLCAQSSSLLEQIGWHGPQAGVIIGLVTGFFAVLMIFIFGYVIRLRRYKRKQIQNVKKVFKARTEQLGLSSVEIQLLVDLQHQEPAHHPSALLDSLSLYERCVHCFFQQKKLDTPGANQQYIIDLLASLRRKIGFDSISPEHPLVSTRNIPIGQSGVLFQPGVRQPLIGRANVTENTEQFFKMHYNTEEQQRVVMQRGDMLRLAFARKNDCLYGIELRVAHFDPSGVITFYHTLDLKRNQLREFVRIAMQSMGKIRLIRTTAEQPDVLKIGESAQVRIVDLSGGGVSFLWQKTLRPGDMLTLQFSLKEEKFVGLRGKVLRVSLQESDVEQQFRHHVQFVGIEAAEQERIVKFVFEKLRLLNQLQ